MRAWLSALVLMSFGAQAADSNSKKLKDSCHITSEPGDVVAKTGNVIIEAGRSVQNVIALDGAVILKKGSSAKSVLAVKGDVTVEKGVEIAESIVVFGGTVKVDPGAHVNGGQISLSDKLSLSGGNGDGGKNSVSGDISINGESLSQMMLREMLKKIEGCVVAEK